MSHGYGHGPYGTTLVEKRGGGTFLALFLAAAFAVAAWRASASSTIATVAFAALAVVVVAIFVVWRLKPSSQLLISPQEIVHRRGQQVHAHWPNHPGTAVRISRNRYGTWLHLLSTNQAPINLMGFDLTEVASACQTNGWNGG